MCELRGGSIVGKVFVWPIRVIERDEVVALLFNVSDIAVAVEKIRLLLGGDDGEEEADEG